MNSFADLKDASLEITPKVQSSRNTYMVVSVVAYLIGITKTHFEQEYDSPKIEYYQQMDENKSARIIRNLCIVRTSILSYFDEIYGEMVYNLKNLRTMPKYIPTECLDQLIKDGVTIEKVNYKPYQYIIDINRLISEHIDDCQDLFPIWLKWPYIKKLFIMPKATTESTIRSAAKSYSRNRSNYPYQVYLNWSNFESGNILYNDKKFVTLLYTQNGDAFKDISKVLDAGNWAKSNIYDFLKNSNRATMVVDCENCDPYRLYATLQNLDKNALLGKIKKVIFFDDVNTTPVWSLFEEYISIPAEHIIIPRVKGNKSLVDIRLTADTCREFYQNNIDSFILCSSDSDYWGLITALPEANFLVMVESEKCSPNMKSAMGEAEIKYCYINDFCSGNTSELKIAAVLSEVKKSIGSFMLGNINEILEDAYSSTRVDMSKVEKTQFYNKYIKPMRLSIANDGELSIVLGSK